MFRIFTLEERSDAAIQSVRKQALDCRASLAMTVLFLPAYFSECPRWIRQLYCKFVKEA
jgi:hypothetical protein